MSKSSSQRRPRYQRISPPPPFKLTKRDLSIVKWVHHYRFLTAEQICALTGGSTQGVTRRLNLLFHNGWLDRPRAQLLMPVRLDFRCNHSMIYALGNIGARYLATAYGLPLATVNWTSKNNRVHSGLFLEHTLLVAQFMVMIQLACRQVAGLEFISQEEIVSKRKAMVSGRNKELGFSVQLPMGSNQRKPFTVSVVPDAMFGLRHTLAGKGPRESYFFVEADRATMPIRRYNLMRSSYYKKMLGYYYAWKEGVFAKIFHFKHARVLTVTTSDQRIENMVEMGRQIDTWNKGLGMFLYLPQKELRLEQPAHIFEQTWVNGRAEKVRIID